MKIGIAGLGFVGSSMFRSFKEKHVDVVGYDKFSDAISKNTLEDCLQTEILFFALPTLYNEETKEYNKDAIYESCKYLQENKYKGVIVLKSTVEPETTENLCKTFRNLEFIHNPEFLTARTAYHDFHHQEHVVLGRSSRCSNENYNKVYAFYANYYPRAYISICSCSESESMKIFVNSFYSVKIQFFNELYLLCEKMGINYNIVRDLMLRNKWFTHHHTNVPGPDGKLSYGGACFPKDTNALLQFMKKYETPSQVLEGNS